MARAPRQLAGGRRRLPRDARAGADGRGAPRSPRRARIEERRSRSTRGALGASEDHHEIASRCSTRRRSSGPAIQNLRSAFSMPTKMQRTTPRGARGHAVSATARMQRRTSTRTSASTTCDSPHARAEPRPRATPTKRGARSESWSRIRAGRSGRAPPPRGSPPRARLVRRGVPAVSDARAAHAGRRGRALSSSPKRRRGSTGVPKRRSAGPRRRRLPARPTVRARCRWRPARTRARSWRGRATMPRALGERTMPNGCSRAQSGSPGRMPRRLGTFAF